MNHPQHPFESRTRALTVGAESAPPDSSLGRGPHAHQLVIERDGITDLFYGRCTCDYHGFDIVALQADDIRRKWAQHVTRTIHDGPAVVSTVDCSALTPDGSGSGADRGLPHRPAGVPSGRSPHSPAGGVAGRPAADSTAAAGHRQHDQDDAA